MPTSPRTSVVPRITRPLLAALLSAFLAPACALDDTADIRVVSYNIHHGAPSGVDDCNPGQCVDLITDICDLLASENPDVIGLQEVDRFTSRSSPTGCAADPAVDCIDQSVFLGDQLGMDSCFGGNIDVLGGEFGNAILSRTPILECFNSLLPCVEAGGGGCEAEQRGVLTARIEVNGASFIVLNTHFESSQVEDRALQAQAIAAIIDATEGPVILVGDLNAGPNAAELAPIRDRLQDAWLIAGDPGDPDGFTKGNRRIDYVYTTVDSVPQFGQVIREPEPSDHFLLFVDLSVPGADGLSVAQ